MLQLGVYALKSKVKLPEYGTSLSSCFDLCFCPTENIVRGYNDKNEQVERFVDFRDGNLTILPSERLLIPTGMVFRLNYQVSIEDFADIVKQIGRAHV